MNRVDDESEEDDLEVTEEPQENKKENAATEEKDDQQTQKKPRKKAPVFTENHLLGANGLSLIYESFPDRCAFRGRGYEAADLEHLMGSYRQWAYNLFPNLAFEDFLLRVEKMGSKGIVRNAMNDFRAKERDHYIRKRYRSTQAPSAPGSDTEIESEADQQQAQELPTQLQETFSRETAPTYLEYDDEEDELQFNEDEMELALQQTPVEQFVE